MKSLALIILTVFMVACSGNEKQGVRYRDMFEKAMENESTAPNFVVINVTDLNNLTTKEICCESLALSFALELESSGIHIGNGKFDSRGIPTYSFMSKEALNQLRFYHYNNKIIDSISTNTGQDLIDMILKEDVESGYSKLLEINTVKFRENYFEHYLYLNGILTYRDCESGFTCISNDK